MTEPQQVNRTYQSCQPCRGNRVVQENWRNSIPVHDKNLSVKHEELLGEEPCIMETPFTYSNCIDDLVDPKSSAFWPYGMTAYEYLKYQHNVK